MSTAVIASAASVQASIAAQQAREAMRISCEALMPSFRHDGSTVEQIHQYAECSSLIYPESMSDGDVDGIKILIAIMFIGIAAGVWIGGRAYEGFDFASASIGAFLCGLGAPIVAVTLYLIYQAGLFLIS